jgi:hypothetical protein
MHGRDILSDQSVAIREGITATLWGLSVYRGESRFGKRGTRRQDCNTRLLRRGGTQPWGLI